MIPNQPKAKLSTPPPPRHTSEISHLHLPPYTLSTPLQMHVDLIDKFSFVQPDDGQSPWPKHVVVIYV
jgi:hypothetical protein